MTWTSFAITPRRRLLATALMYGLSLTVRLTSATGEEGIKPAQTAHCAAMVSIPFNDKPALTAFRTTGLQDPVRGRSCHAGCEPALPT